MTCSLLQQSCSCAHAEHPHWFKDRAVGRGTGSIYCSSAHRAESPHIFVMKWGGRGVFMRETDKKMIASAATSFHHSQRPLVFLPLMSYIKTLGWPPPANPSLRSLLLGGETTGTLEITSTSWCSATFRAWSQCWLVCDFTLSRGIVWNVTLVVAVLCFPVNHQEDI